MMATVAEFYRDIGVEIGDPGNAEMPTWRLLIWINRAVKDAVIRTDCLWEKNVLTGQQLITIVDYTGLTGNTVTITMVTNGATTLTEAVEWTAATSNSATATSLATALTALTGVKAYALGACVYVCGSDDTFSALTSNAATTKLTIADAGYENYNLNSVLTRFRKIRNIYEVGNNVFYIPYDRQQYDICIMKSEGFEGDVYTVVPDNMLYIKSGGANLTSDVTFTIEYYQYPTSLSAGSSSPPGILANYDDLIIRRTLYYYFLSVARYDDARIANELYEDNITRVRRELQEHGEPQTLEQFYKLY